LVFIVKKYPVIIIEGKKEDVAKRLKQRFEYDGPFIDRILDVDPTKYKYVEYIAKKLEKIIPELAGEKGGLNVQQGESLQDLFGTIIPWFHANVNRIKEDDIWNAETAFRNDMNSSYVVPNIQGIAKSPKDINQYENPQFIKKLMVTIDSRKTQRQIEREIKTQADKIYEDDDVLVVRPKSHSASCYYGANTKWCTTQKGHSSYFDKYSREGNLYYFLNKKNNNKIALYRNESERQTEVFDAQDARRDIEFLKEYFPNQSDLIDDLTGIGEFIKKLREFTKGRINSDELMESDSSLYGVETKEPLGQSKIIIDFGDDENFFKNFDISEDDIWFMNAINSHYSDYEFIDSYTVEEDWKEGYIVFGDLNDENKEKLQQIAELILPSKEFDLNSDEYRQELSATLLDLFERETDNILSDYFVEKNREMSVTARESIEKEIDGVLESSGFKLVRKYDIIATTAANLVMWSTRLGINKTDVISLFNQIMENNGGNMGGWAEDQYEYQDYDNFDSDSFNREVERQFDSILEKIEDDGTQINDFINLRKKILSKYNIGKWYELPKDKSIKFKIKNFDRDDMQIVVEIQLPTGFITRKFNEEQFNYLLYQPELFKFGEV
jgi:hypothetical protein